MSSYEVPEPIISSPFEELQEHWNIIEGEVPERVAGRRKAIYFYRDPKPSPGKAVREVGTATLITLWQIRSDGSNRLRSTWTNILLSRLLSRTQA